ncbi:MAG: hypothetical protein ACK5XN_31225, partial [Bacteroidota bacterium]
MREKNASPASELMTRISSIDEPFRRAVVELMVQRFESQLPAKNMNVSEASVLFISSLFARNSPLP